MTGALQRYFHGFNVVYKGPPWHPRVDGVFDARTSMSPKDLQDLENWCVLTA